MKLANAYLDDDWDYVSKKDYEGVDPDDYDDVCEEDSADAKLLPHGKPNYEDGVLAELLLVFAAWFPAVFLFQLAVYTNKWVCSTCVKSGKYFMVCAHCLGMPM